VAGIREKVKVIVGGAPVTRSWAKDIGADGFAEDAMGAVAVAKQLVGKG
jgi:methanogenic corrinoid protein MtbC1